MILFPSRRSRRTLAALLACLGFAAALLALFSSGCLAAPAATPPAGAGVTFELTPADNTSLLGSVLQIVFEKALYVPPGGVGTAVKNNVEVRSKQFVYFPNSEMLVKFSIQLNTE